MVELELELELEARIGRWLTSGGPFHRVSWWAIVVHGTSYTRRIWARIRLSFFFPLEVSSAVERATFGGLPEVDGVPAKDLFLHDEGDGRGSLAVEDVFSGGDNFPSADNGEI